MAKIDYPAPPVKATLYAHQLAGYRQALDTLETRRGYGLLYEMGCGKSLTAVAIMGRLYLDGRVARVLIVAPSTVCAVWPSELAKYAGYPAHCAVLRGTRAKRVAALQTLSRCQRGLLVAVINYESAWRLERELRAWRPDMIICDESQRIKTPTAAQSKAMHRLGDAARYKMILSGTPIQATPLDIWSQYRFLDPTVFGTRFTAYKSRYAVMGGYMVNGRPVQVVSYRHLDELSAKVYSIAQRVTKAEALDLPRQTYEVRPVELDTAERAAYREMQRESMLRLGGGTVTAPIVLTQKMRLRQITGGFVRTDDGGEVVQVGHSKLDALREIVEDYALDGGGKLVIFAAYVPEVLAICGMLDKLMPRAPGQPPGYACIYGDVPMAERDEGVRRLQTDPDCLALVGQIDTAGVGLTLTAAHLTVYYSINYNYGTYDQSMSRVHRISQDHDCHYIHLVATGTVDEEVKAAVDGKATMAEMVLGAGKDTSAFGAGGM